MINLKNTSISIYRTFQFAIGKNEISNMYVGYIYIPCEHIQHINALDFEKEIECPGGITLNIILEGLGDRIIGFETWNYMDIGELRAHDYTECACMSIIDQLIQRIELF